ncbi:transmembrane protein 179B [Neosynchiropus ocellatus]
MALSLLLPLELALYTACFMCGIVTAASVTIVQGHFGGQCILYGLVSYNSSAASVALESSGAASLCYFVSSVSVLVAVVCFSLSLYWIYDICFDGEVTRERVWMNAMVGVSGVALFFLLISGCMLKIGRDSLCESVLSRVPNITRCEEAQSRTWASPLDGKRFFDSLLKAETSVWVNFFFWIVIGVLVFLQRRQQSGSKVIIGGPAGGLFGDPGVTAAETEPFFNRAARAMSEDQFDSVAVSVESLLSDAKRMQQQCRERSEQLALAATQLRVESSALREQSEEALLNMATMRRQLDELLDTKAAFEARERQARKLSKQL